MTKKQAKNRLPVEAAEGEGGRPGVAVWFEGEAARDRAGTLAEALSLPMARKFRDPHPLWLVVISEPDSLLDFSVSAAPPGLIASPDPDNSTASGGRLELRVVEPGHPLAGGHGVFADLTQLDTTSPAGRSLKTPLLKAVGINKRAGADRPHVLDATAGLGEDAWLLAAAGCRVTALERHPIIHALLADALARARRTAPDLADRIDLRPCADAADFLREHADDSEFDVVLIDPMFPGAARRKTTERKPMRVLRWLVGDDEDADGLLEMARKAAKKRVVVKRPRFAPHLAGVEPTAVHAGRGLRFEVVPASTD